jgi:hypothetical protein
MGTGLSAGAFRDVKTPKHNLGFNPFKTAIKNKWLSEMKKKDIIF